MSTPTLGITKEGNPDVYRLYEVLMTGGVTLTELDHGVARANYAGKYCADATTLSCVDGAGDDVVTAEEIWDFALEHGEQYQPLIEGLLGRQLPWALDDGDPHTTFDAKIRERIDDAARTIQAILTSQAIEKGTAEYEEKLALGLFYFVALPSAAEIALWKEGILEIRTKALHDAGLEELRSYLIKNGGLAIRSEYGEENSALDALKKKRGKCTEVANILYSVLKRAGLSPFFVEVDLWKTEIPGLKQVLANAPSDGHVCVGLTIGNRTRLLDATLPMFDAPHKRFWPLSRRQFLGGIFSNVGALLKDPQKKLQAFATSIELDQFAVGAYLNRANDLLQAGNMRGGLDDIEKAVRANPDYAPAYSTRCLMMAENGSIADAKASCIRSIQLNPEQALGYVASARVLLLEGKVQEALQMAAKGVGIAPMLSSAHLVYGMALAANGGTDSAIAELNRAIQIEPLYVAARYTRGVLYATQQKMDQALADFDEIIRCVPGHADAHKSRGKILYEQGNYERAIADLTQYLDGHKEAGAYIARGVSFLATDRWAQAIEDFSQAISLEPSAVNAVQEHVERVRMTYWKQDPHRVELSKVLGIEPALLEASVIAASAVWEAEHTAEALQYISAQGSKLSAGIAADYESSDSLLESTFAYVRTLFIRMPKALRDMPEIHGAWGPFLIDEFWTAQQRALQTLTGSVREDKLIKTCAYLWVRSRSTGESLPQILGRKIAERCLNDKTARDPATCLIGDESKKAYSHHKVWQEQRADLAKEMRPVRTIVNEMARIGLSFRIPTYVNEMSAVNRETLRGLLKTVTLQAYVAAEERDKGFLRGALAGLRNVPPDLVDAVIEARWAIGAE